MAQRKYCWGFVIVKLFYISSTLEIWFSLNEENISCIVTSKNMNACKICSIDRRGYVRNMYIKTTLLCVLISYFGSVCLQEFVFWRVNCLRNFFVVVFWQFSFAGILFWEFSPFPPVISNGPPLKWSFHMRRNLTNQWRLLPRDATISNRKSGGRIIDFPALIELRLLWSKYNSTWSCVLPKIYLISTVCREERMLNWNDHCEFWVSDEFGRLVTTPHAMWRIYAYSCMSWILLDLLSK